VGDSENVCSTVSVQETNRKVQSDRHYHTTRQTGLAYSSFSRERYGAQYGLVDHHARNHIKRADLDVIANVAL
jgi:hypothetical protein